MQILRRLGWILLCSFVAVLGAAAALTIVLKVLDASSASTRAEKLERTRTSLFYIKNNEAEISDLTEISITRGAGYRGKLTNHWNRELHSFRVAGEFKRNGEVLFTTGETVDLSIKPGETKLFQVVFRDVDAKSLTPDIQSEVRVVWLKDSYF